MPRVLVTDDNGTVAWDERVIAADFATEHFRRQLSDRLSWAVADAQTCRRPDTDASDAATTIRAPSPTHLEDAGPKASLDLP
jgi:hypothetical protein